MTTQQRDTLLCQRAAPQRAFERRAPAQHRDGPAFRGSGDRRTGGHEVVDDVRHLRVQGVDDLTAEGMGVMKLHHALALPRGLKTRWRTRVSVDQDHLAATASEGDREEQPRWTRSDDNTSHWHSQQIKVALSVMNTLRVT